jgi:hypothetical protein
VYSFDQVFLGDFDGDGYTEIGCGYFEYIFTNSSYITIINTPQMAIMLGVGSIVQGTTLFPTQTYLLHIEIANMTPGRLPENPLHVQFREDKLGLTANLSIDLSDGRITIHNDSLFRLDTNEILNDGQNLSIPLDIEPIWEVLSEGFHSIEIEFTDRLGIRVNATFHDHFRVETDLVFDGPLTILDSDGEPVSGSWVRPGDVLSLSGPIVVFEGSDGLIAPVDAYMIEIMTDNVSMNHSVAEVGEWIPFSLPELMSEPVITIRVFDVHKGEYSRSVFRQELMLDSDPPEVIDHFPPDSAWFSSEYIMVGIRFIDQDSGMDLDHLRYTLDDVEWVDVDRDIIVSNDTGYTVELHLRFTEGRNTLVWSLDDNVGHSLSFVQQVNVDLTNILFSDFKPYGWQNTIQVGCSVTLTDINGSGVDGRSIEYSYSSTDIFSFSPWIPIDRVNSGEIVTSDFVVEGIEGETNMIMVRGRDIAGNKAISSEIYVFGIDVTYPEIHVVDLYDGQVKSPLNRTIVVKIVEMGSSIDQITPTLLNLNNGEGTEITFDVQSVSIGISIITIRWAETSSFDLGFCLTCTDTAGNPGSIDLIEFSINKPPFVEITSPVKGTWYEKGEEIMFSSRIEDPEGGSVVIVWLLDGLEMIGNERSVTNRSLSAGSHSITLTVNDEYHSVTATSEFEIHNSQIESNTDSGYLIIVIFVIIIVIPCAWYILSLRKERTR